MKARIQLLPNTEYKIQWKTRWFWHDYNDTGVGELAGDWSSIFYYDTDEDATLAMIEMIQLYEI